MARALFAILVLLITTPGLGADALDPKGPIAAMKRFHRAIASGKLGRAEGFVIKAKEERRHRKLEKSIASTAKMMRAGSLEMKTCTARVRGKWAVVVTVIEITRDGKTERRVRDEFMLRRKKQWKVVPEALRSDPAVRPLIDGDFQALFEWYRENRERLAKDCLR